MADVVVHGELIAAAPGLRNRREIDADGGQVIADRCEWLGEPGRGRFLRRSY
jgi:hypothetical protein